MNYIYLNTIKNFVNANYSNVLSTFEKKFKIVYGKRATIEQKKAWESSVKYLQNALNYQCIYNQVIVFEYRLPFSNERIDLLIFGRGETNIPTIILFELKGWKRAEETTSVFIVNSDLGKSVHPEYQVENYVGKLRFSHSEAGNFNIIPAVLMYNATSNTINLKFKKFVFFKDDISGLRSFVAEWAPNPLDLEIVNRFLNGQYIQSKKLFDAIKKHFTDIQKQSYLALAKNGWGLSSEQLELVDEITQDLKSGKSNTVYLIQGSPGSGKTLLAIHLLLSSLKHGFQSILAYRNNRLINSIRDIFDSIERGLSNPIKFYSVGPKAGFRGVAEKNFNGSILDFVIYDEAQRMTKENIHYALKRGKVTVFFYDEAQILNAEEEGTTENFRTEAQRQGMLIKERFLRGFYRVNGGELYHKFIETLLREPERINSDLIIPWNTSYEFKVLKSIEELLFLLGKKREEGFKVALIAAFTESPGDLRDQTSLKNLRIGYPLYSGLDIYKDFNKKIYWLMDPKNDYVPFWVKEESNKLEKCASIYGCQGFETDFAGIIWGRDFVFRNGKWELGENCEDNIGNPGLKDLINQAKKGKVDADIIARRLLENRYRIFLTRGIKGTYIFCEDEETANFLRRIYNDFLA